jgi:F-type H+-transporting ATPase subunit b
MSRPSILRLGLLALALAVVPAGLARAWAEDPHAATADAKGGAAQAAAHGGGDPNILEPQPSLMLWTVIVFLVLMAVLWKFAWGPLTEALAERERKQDEVVRLAEEARAESARLLAEHKRQMESAAEQVRQMLEEARRQAEANSLRIAADAQAAADATRERAERDIGTAKEQALSEIWSKTADLAVSIAGKVLAKELRHDDHRRLVDAAVDELPGAGANGHGGRHA